MSKREIAVLICKALSLYGAIMAVDNLPRVFQEVIRVISTLMLPPASTRLTGTIGAIQSNSISVQSMLWTLTHSVLPFTMQLLVVLVLWFGAASIAERMVHEYPDEPNINLHGVDVKGIAFASIGLLQLVQTVPTLMLALIAGLWNALFWTAPMTGYGYQTIPFMFRTLLGLCLVLQWPGVIGVIRSLQNMGKPSTPQSTQMPEAAASSHSTS